MLFWENLHRQLEQQPLVLLTVVHSEGSSPGRQGFKMWVTEKDMDGSIGGGFMEHKLVELAKSLLSSGPFSPFIKRQIHRKNAPRSQSGMICSGEQTVVFHYLDSQHLSEIQSINQGKQLVLNSQGAFAVTTPLEKTITWEQKGEQWEYKEKLYHQSTVYIVGAGHVGLAVSKIMQQLDFYVVLLDNRPNLNTMEENSYANEKHLVDYQEIIPYLPEGADHYVVLMSFGYRSDEIIIRQLLGKNYAYIGMLGSQNKVDTLFDQLEEQEFSRDDLNKVYAPIGIPIHSKTPEEIAISIAAQIIQVKNQHNPSQSLPR